jgi:hypothetical protein
MYIVHMSTCIIVYRIALRPCLKFNLKPLELLSRAPGRLGRCSAVAGRKRESRAQQRALASGVMLGADCAP